MSQIIEVKVPDIGDFSDVPVIDLFVKVGDSIKVDDAIATLESDKATMDVPSTVAGTITEVLVQLGSKVSEGAVLIDDVISTGSTLRGLRLLMQEARADIVAEMAVFTEGNDADWNQVIALGHLPVFTD